jgi:SagB-type dehydrogenase family enzyme
MTHTDFLEPIPRSHPKAYESPHWDIAQTIHLDVPRAKRQIDFWHVLDSRSSRREFVTPNNDTLSEILWYTCKSKRRLDKDGIRIHKNIPSAGALHPISIIVQSMGKGGLSLYDDVSHSMLSLGVSEEKIDALSRLVSSVLDTKNGTVFWFVADVHKVDCFYENANSLILRDSGVILANLCLVAEALNLASCPLGILGDAVLKESIAMPWQMRGVGAWVVGERDHLDESSEVT